MRLQHVTVTSISGHIPFSPEAGQSFALAAQEVRHVDHAGPFQSYSLHIHSAEAVFPFPKDMSYSTRVRKPSVV